MSFASNRTGGFGDVIVVRQVKFWEFDGQPLNAQRYRLLSKGRRMVR